MATSPGMARPGRRRREDEEDEDAVSNPDGSVEGEGSAYSSSSKRPRLDLEEDDNLLGNPSEDEGPLPDSFRRSPKNKQRSNGSTVNGNARHGNDPPSKHQPGSLVRVTLTNFVTYTKAEFKLGPHLNMVIGPNGTGKSTLVCAICLGLGWSTSHLGRAKDLGEFVKHGAKRAEIEIELAADPDRHVSNPVITTRVTKEGNKAEYFIDRKKVTRKALQELAASFAIQVDNLCQFLPQDRVAEFAALSPVDLLTHTQKAAAPAYMTEWHEELKTLRKQQKTNFEEQQRILESLKHMENRQKTQQADVERLRERSELKGKIAAYEKLRPFAAYKESIKTFKEAKATKKVAERELKKLEERVEPNLRAVKDKEDYIERIKDVVSKRTTILARYEGTKNEMGKKIAGLVEALNGCAEEITAEKAAVFNVKKSIPKLQQGVQQIQRALKSPPESFDPAELNEKIREKVRQERDLGEKLTDLRTQVGSMSEQIKQRERIINDKEQEKAHLQSQAGQQVNKLRQVSRDAAQMWDWIERNRGAFQSEVHGPPVVSCSVKDTRRFAAAVETMIPDGDKLSFTVTSQRDMKMLLDQASHMGLHDINIRVSLQPLASFASPPVNGDQLQQMGLEGWLLDLIEGPDAVLAMLCDNRSIQSMAYAVREISEKQFDSLKRSPIGSWVTPSQSYTISRRREYGDAAVSTRVQALKQARFWTDAPVDRLAEREIDSKILEAKGDIEELQQSLTDVKKEGVQAQAEKKQLMADKKEIEDDKATKQRAQAEFNALEPKLTQAQGKLADAEEKIRGFRERLRAIVDRGDKLGLDKGQLAIDFANAIEQLRGLHMQLYEAEIMLIEGRSDHEQLQAQHREEVDLLEQRRKEVATLTQAAAEALERGKKLQEKCAAIGSTLSDAETALFNVINDEEWLPERLETEIQSVQARLDMTHGGANSDNVIREFERRARDIVEKRAKLNEIDEALESVLETITEVREKWEPELDALVAKISEAFRENFEQIQCVGEVAVGKDEDEFENWAIHIRVKFRETEQLSLLDSHRQSGGERAVSTIFYLMALQSLARAPFRVVDEINQGMDPRNERLVHSRMVDIACAAAGENGAQQGSQYFLITPKLLPGLKYHPKMKVHCIGSGEYMPSDHRELDFGALARKALDLKRRNGEATESRHFVGAAA